MLRITQGYLPPAPSLFSPFSSPGGVAAVPVLYPTGLSAPPRLRVQERAPDRASFFNKALLDLSANCMMTTSKDEFLQARKNRAADSKK